MSRTDSPDYAPFYCEENVWRLLGRRGGPLDAERGVGRAFAVLISNPHRRVAMLRQRAGRGPRGFVSWDYHVVAALVEPSGEALAFDLDTALGFPCPLEGYAAESFPPDAPDDLSPRFLVFPAERYLSGLVSDRSHMRAPDGSWLAPPPPWPAPGAGSGRASVLMEWVEAAALSPLRSLDAESLRGADPRSASRRATSPGAGDHSPEAGSP